MSILLVIILLHTTIHIIIIYHKKLLRMRNSPIQEIQEKWVEITIRGGNNNLPFEPELSLFICFLKCMLVRAIQTVGSLLFRLPCSTTGFTQNALWVTLSRNQKCIKPEAWDDTQLTYQSIYADDLLSRIFVTLWIFCIFWAWAYK